MRRSFILAATAAVGFAILGAAAPKSKGKPSRLPDGTNAIVRITPDTVRDSPKFVEAKVIEMESLLMVTNRPQDDLEDVSRVFADVDRMVEIGDKLGIVQLTRQEQMFRVAANTPVLVTGYQTNFGNFPPFAKQGMYCVRVLEGPAKGMVGFLYPSCIAAK